LYPRPLHLLPMAAQLVFTSFDQPLRLLQALQQNRRVHLNHMVPAPHRRGSPDPNGNEGAIGVPGRPQSAITVGGGVWAGSFSSSSVGRSTGASPGGGDYFCFAGVAFSLSMSRMVMEAPSILLSRVM